MSATFNAELYASKTRTAHATLNAEIYASGEIKYRIEDDYDTEATYENDMPQLPFTLNGDTEIECIRPVVFIPELYASTNKSAHASLNGELYATADPLRYLINDNYDSEVTYENDSGQAPFALNGDTDIEYKAPTPSTSNFDTEVNIVSDDVLNGDTSILYHQGQIDFEANLDTEIYIANEVENNFDTVTKTQVKEELNFDTSIQVAQRFISNFDSEIKIAQEVHSNFDTELNIENENFKTFAVNGDTNIEFYRKITHSYGVVDCKTIDLGDVYTVEVAISIEGEGFAKVKYTGGNSSSDYQDYKPQKVKCRYIYPRLYVRDRITAAKLQVIPVPKEVTVTEHIPINGKKVNFEAFLGTPMIFPSASQYNVKVKDVTKKSCYVTLYDENNNSVEGDVALLIKG